MREVLDAVGTPPGWQCLPLTHVVARSKSSGRPDLEPLSVYLDAGVVPRASREDNHNRLGEDASKYLVVHPGDIVFNRLRTWQGGLGVSHHTGIVSPAYFVCRPLSMIEPRFLHYLLRSTVYLAELTRISKFMPPSQFDILWDDLRCVPVLTPPLAAQRAIADYLDTETARVDTLIAKKRRLVELLEERRRVVTHEAVFESGAPLVLLRLAARLGSGHTPSRDRPEWWADCTIPWITTGEVAQMRDDRIEYVSETRECISDLGLANSAAELHPEGTVVLCRTASAGYSAIMDQPMATSQDFATWTCGSRLNPRFLLLCLRAMRPDLLGRLAMGSTHKTIYMPDIQALRIPLPALDEQARIVNRAWDALHSIDRTCDALDRQITLLAERRQALITAAVTGELDVPGAAA